MKTRLVPARADSPDATWQLLEFFKIHGHYDVPQRWTANPKLAAWVSAQRRAHQNGSLPDAFANRLNALGFRWEPFSDKWREMYEALSKFRSRTGHTRVPQRWKENLRLAHWVAVQRRQKKLGRLSEDRIAKLDSLRFDWTPARGGGVGKSGIRGPAWEAMFAQLEDFYREYGHSCVPQQYKANPKLGWWVTTQRRNRRKNRLAPDQISRLDALQFSWSPIKVGSSRRAEQNGTIVPKADRWEEMLGALKAFKAQHGHCRVPQHFKDNRRLADWVSRLRISRNKRRLPAEQEKILTDLGFDWNPIATKWDMMFESLVEYKKRFGHTNVPQKSREYPELAAWVANERYDKKKKKPISASRAARLDALGFTWEFNPAFTWEDMFNALLDFKKIYGHCNVPQHWKENKRLGKWVNTQRTARKRGKLTAEREAKLNQMGFAWHLAPTNKRLVLVNVTPLPAKEKAQHFD